LANASHRENVTLGCTGSYLAIETRIGTMVTCSSGDFIDVIGPSRSKNVSCEKTKRRNAPEPEGRRQAEDADHPGRKNVALFQSALPDPEKAMSLKFLRDAKRFGRRRCAPVP
jgi:hypothetical protein